MNDAADDFDGPGAANRSNETKDSAPYVKVITSFDGIPGAWALPAEHSAEGDVVSDDDEFSISKPTIAAILLVAALIGVGLASMQSVPEADVPADKAGVAKAQSQGVAVDSSIEGAHLSSGTSTKLAVSVDAGKSNEGKVDAGKSGNGAKTNSPDAGDKASPALQPTDDDSDDDDVLLELPSRRKARFHNKMATRLMLKGKYRTAKRHLLNAVSLDSTLAISYRNLGVVNARLGKRVQAKKAYETYIRLAPTADDAPDVRRLLGL